MKRAIAVLLVAAMAFGMTACGSKNSGNNGGSTEAGKSDGTVYAVEAGSAGEEAAKENGFQYNSVSSQADALMEVKSGTSDAAIIDLLMAGAMIGEGTSYPDLTYTDKLTTEEYGVGCRKGSDLASYINQVFAESYADGTMQDIAKKYGVQEAILEQDADAKFEQSDSDSDVDYIKDKGKLVVGITEFEPMDYKDGDEWVGFDADMARLVAEKLGVEAGQTYNFDQVLAVNNGEMIIGTPTVAGATVSATVMGEGRAKKVIVYKYKRKTGYHKKNGHRQSYTELKIEKINA